jgi:hypothetical protein
MSSQLRSLIHTSGYVASSLLLYGRVAGPVQMVEVIRQLGEHSCCCERLLLVNDTLAEPHARTIVRFDVPAQPCRANTAASNSTARVSRATAWGAPRPPSGEQLRVRPLIRLGRPYGHRGRAAALPGPAQRRRRMQQGIRQWPRPCQCRWHRRPSRGRTPRSRPR